MGGVKFHVADIQVNSGMINFCEEVEYEFAIQLMKKTIKNI